MLLEGIETLLVLSKEKTMSRTGSQLYISQSAVSKRIANLEKKLGKKLARARRYVINKNGLLRNSRRRLSEYDYGRATGTRSLSQNLDQSHSENR